MREVSLRQSKLCFQEMLGLSKMPCMKKANLGVLTKTPRDNACQAGCDSVVATCSVKVQCDDKFSCQSCDFIVQFCHQHGCNAVTTRNSSMLTGMNQIVVHRMVHELSTFDCPDAVQVGLVKVEDPQPTDSCAVPGLLDHQICHSFPSFQDVRASDCTIDQHELTVQQGFSHGFNWQQFGACVRV